MGEAIWSDPYGPLAATLMLIVVSLLVLEFISMLAGGTVEEDLGDESDG